MSQVGQAAPLLQVRFVKSILQQKKATEVAELVRLIQQWKPAETDHWYFGKDVPNLGNNSLVWHAHLRPNISSEQPAWDANYDNIKKSRPFDRTSNHLMFYSMDKRHPYRHGLLVIRIVTEPDGHKPFKNTLLLDTWEAIAYRHQALGLDH